jgi:hypothetical protein
LSHLYIKCIILPRQARDKHRENSKKCRFLAGSKLWTMLPPPHAVYTRRHASVDAVQVPLEAKARCAKQNASFAMPVYAQNAIILPSQARDKIEKPQKER